MSLSPRRTPRGTRAWHILLMLIVALQAVLPPLTVPAQAQARPSAPPAPVAPAPNARWTPAEPPPPPRTPEAPPRVAQGHLGPQGGTLTSTDGSLTLTLPPGALTTTTTLTLTATISARAAHTGRGTFARLTLTAMPDTPFATPAQITLNDLPARATNLHATRFDLRTRTLAPAPVTAAGTHTTLTTDAPGAFALTNDADDPQAPTDEDLQSGWHLLFTDAQVAHFSGGARYALPLDLAPGRGGLTPDLTLTYDSRRVDGLLTWAQSDWLGLGWSLDTAEIVREITPRRFWWTGNVRYENRFTLLLNGASYDLVPESPTQFFGRYHTREESFLYIERVNPRSCGAQTCPRAPNATGEYWLVRTPTGVEYRFGYSADSEQIAQYVYSYSDACQDPCVWRNGQPPLDARYAGETRYQVAYRWRVERVRDLSGNMLAYRYDEERDAVREHASYLTEIAYTPLDAGGWGYRVVLTHRPRGSAPDTINDGDAQWRSDFFWFQSDYLDHISLYGPDGAHVRTYQFAYALTPEYDDPLLEGRQLHSVTVLGRDGRALPTTTFDYTVLASKGWRGLGCQCWDDSTFLYDRLTHIDNGYGGTLDLTYATFDSGWWQAWNYHVTRKTTSSAIGPVAVRDFTYTRLRAQQCYGGAPADPLCRYVPNEQESGGRFTGFSQVTETLRMPDGTALNSTAYTFVLNSASDPNAPLGHPSRVRTLAPTGTALTDETTAYLTRAHDWPGGGRTFFSAPAVLTTTTFDDGLTTTSVTRYAYDAYGNPSETMLLGDPLTSSDDKRIVRAYALNPSPSVWLLDRVLWERVYPAAAPEGGETAVALIAYAYDDAPFFSSLPPTRGRLTAQARYHTLAAAYDDDRLRAITRYTYDAYGNLLSATDPLGASTRYAYDAYLHTYPISETNALGHTTTRVFDFNFGRPLALLAPNGATTQIGYDEFGRLARVAEPGDTLALPTRQWDYTATAPGLRITLDARITSGTPDTTRTLAFYDGLGRLLQTRTPAPDGQQAVRNRVYDARDLVFADYAPAYEPTRTDFLRAPGWYTRAATRTTYDALGRPLTLTGPDGAQTTTAYRGRALLQRAPNGHQVRTTYNAFGQALEVAEYLDAYASADWNAPVYALTRYAYDSLGNLTSVVDAQGRHTDLRYNALGWKLSSRDPNLGYWQYAYDNAGQLTQQTDAAGQTLLFAYDALGRATRTWSAPNGVTQELATYTYDEGPFGRGRRTTQRDATGTTRWAYDARGQVLTETRDLVGLGRYLTTQAYDAAGRPTRLTYPTGEVVSTTYNAAGLPSALTGASGPLVASTQYTARGELAALTFGNLTATTFRYDDAPDACARGACSLRLLEQRVTAGTQTLWSQSLRYDAAGNLSGLTDTRATAPTETLAYTYDGLDRLMAVSGDFNERYSYDALGNLTRLGAREYRYSDPAHPHAATQAGTDSFAYDANGNLSTRVELSGTQMLTWRQQWDSANQLISATRLDSGARWTLGYDGAGTLVTQRGPDNGLSALTQGGLFEDRAYTLDTWDGWQSNTWSAGSGTWGVTNGAYMQSNAQATTTRTTRALPQSGAHSYTWRTRFVQGTVAAVQVFSADAQASTGYRIVQDARQVAIYTVMADSGARLLAAWPALNAAGQTHSYQVFVDALTGRVRVWRDDIALGDALDRARQWSGGAYVHLLTFSTQAAFDDLRVGQLVTHYTFAGRPVAERRAGVLAYLHGDPLGSTGLVTCGTAGACGALGAVVASARYTPFGVVRAGGVPVAFTFTGARTAGFGLVYRGARWYHPGLARWASADALVPGAPDGTLDPDTRQSALTVDFHEPALRASVAHENAPAPWFFATADARALRASGPLTPQALNRYAYVQNAPLMYADPSGHTRIPYFHVKAVLIGMHSNLDDLYQKLNHATWQAQTAGGATGAFVGGLIGMGLGALVAGPVGAGLGIGIGAGLGGAIGAFIGDSTLNPLRQEVAETQMLTEMLDKAVASAEQAGLIGYEIDVIWGRASNETYTVTINVVDAQGNIIEINNVAVYSQTSQAVSTSVAASLLNEIR